MTEAQGDVSTKSEAEVEEERRLAEVREREALEEARSKKISAALLRYRKRKAGQL